MRFIIANAEREYIEALVWDEEHLDHSSFCIILIIAFARPADPTDKSVR